MAQIPAIHKSEPVISHLENRPQDLAEILQVLKVPLNVREQNRDRLPLCFRIKQHRTGQMATLTYEQTKQKFPYLLISYFEQRAVVRNVEDDSSLGVASAERKIRTKASRPFKQQTQQFHGQDFTLGQLNEELAQPIHHDHLNMREPDQPRPPFYEVEETGCYDVASDGQEEDIYGLIDCEGVFSEIGMAAFRSPVYFQPVKWSKAAVAKIKADYQNCQQ